MKQLTDSQKIFLRKLIDWFRLLYKTEPQVVLPNGIGIISTNRILTKLYLIYQYGTYHRNDVNMLNAFREFYITHK